jgi:hypothetical protein
VAAAQVSDWLRLGVVDRDDREGDEIVRQDAEGRGREAAAEGGAPEPSARDALEDLERRGSPQQPKEDDGVDRVEGSDDERAVQNRSGSDKGGATCV